LSVAGLSGGFVGREVTNACENCEPDQENERAATP